MHLKINAAPKQWPISRKGRKFIVVPANSTVLGLPLLILLRDLLKIAHTRREVQLILQAKKVSINNKIIQNERFSVGLFDIVSIGEKIYRLVLQEKGKFSLDSQEERIAKIIGKRLLPGNKTQISLQNGYNFITKETFHVGDSVEIKKGEISRIIPLKKGANALVFEGRLAGARGIVEKIEGRFANVAITDAMHIIPIKNLMSLP